VDFWCITLIYMGFLMTMVQTSGRAAALPRALFFPRNHKLQHVGNFLTHVTCLNIDRLIRTIMLSRLCLFVHISSFCKSAHFTLLSRYFVDQATCHWQIIIACVSRDGCLCARARACVRMWVCGCVCVCACACVFHDSRGVWISEDPR